MARQLGFDEWTRAWGSLDPGSLRKRQRVEWRPSGYTPGVPATVRGVIRIEGEPPIVCIRTHKGSPMLTHVHAEPTEIFEGTD